MRNASLSIVMLIATALCVTGCDKADQSNPKAAAKTFLVALVNNNPEDAKKVSTGVDSKTLETMAGMANGMKRLYDAGKSKFGDEVKKLDVDQFADIGKDIDNAGEKIEDDVATLTIKEPHGSPWKVKKIDGEWKVLAGDRIPPEAKLSQLRKAGETASETADEINNGKYKNADEAKKAMDKKLDDYRKAEQDAAKKAAEEAAK